MRTSTKLIFLLLLGLFCSSSLTVQAQTAEKHLVLFKTKLLTASPSSFLSPRSLARRQKQGISVKAHDYPVTPANIDSLTKTGVQVWYTTRWLNGALVSGTPEQLAAVQKLSVVKSASQVSRVGSGTKTKSAGGSALYSVAHIASPREVTALNYGLSNQQVSMLDVPTMHNDGFFGEGLHIAIIDAGFENANNMTCLDSLFKRNRVLGTYDFVERNTSVYEDDEHGANVLSIMAGYSPGSLIGPAFRANYWLFRTEDVATEKPLEEVNWLMAAERADSLGVDIINTSLGYFSFENAAYDHKKAEFDGNTTIIARAADFAAASGILVVVSAGNEGGDPWNYISTPADGDSVLTVGAITGAGQVASFSSPGPSADGQIKPDVTAMGVQVVIGSSTGGFRKGNGTSFSAPLVAAFAAGVWQAFPELSVGELLKTIRESGNNTSNPNNSVGYGVPSYTRIKEKLNPTGIQDEEGPLAEAILFPNPVQGGRAYLRFSKPSSQGKMMLYSTSGALVWQQEIRQKQSTIKMALPEQLKGLFLLSVSTEEGRKQWRLWLE